MGPLVLAFFLREARLAFSRVGLLGFLSTLGVSYISSHTYQLCNCHVLDRPHHLLSAYAPSPDCSPATLSFALLPMLACLIHARPTDARSCKWQPGP